MEILIIGGILVLIMVVVSTQIKKSAARAFEREIIETDNFRIVKPEGFINPIRERSAYLFEAYTKDFGEKSERNIWKAQAYLTVSENSNFASECKNAKNKTETILSEKIDKDATAAGKICLLESEKVEKEFRFNEFHKIVESKKQRRIYDLRIMVLHSFREELIGRIDEMINSFQVK